MKLKIVVLAKQVPDTRNVGKDAMTAEGTVNRAALPAIFNPDDLLALEQALRLKEQNPGSTVGVLTMGPPRAGEIIRQGLYRGADTGWLLTDRLFAGADTLATSRTPALILLDLMLPDMDGYEIVRQVKGRADMRTLPVIMLTALGDERHQLKAYRAGADDFMVKPCNWRLLVARAMQLIKWAATTSERTATTPGTSPAGTDKEKGQGETVFTSHADKAFKERVDALIGAHMTDEQFGIDMLTEMMEMGHTKFYGRMREVTGMTPNRYVMDFRMRRAAELLLKGRLNVGEVAWKVGIQDQSYFNKCFKAQYGVSPSKYGK